MNATLKQAIADKKKTRKPIKSRIVQTRMDEDLYAKAGKVLKARGLKWGDYFRSAAKQLIA